MSIKKLLAFLTGISLAFLACDGSSSSPAFPETTPESSSSIATSDSISSKTEIRSSSSIAIPFLLSSSSWDSRWDINGCCPESGAQSRVITLTKFGDTVNVTLGEKEIFRDSLCIPPPPSVIIITCNPPKITYNDSIVIDSSISVTSSNSILRDNRDGELYKTIKIGDHIWMAENLRILSEYSECYKNDRNNCKEYGALYKLSEAKYVCPTGWRLPTAEEWPKEPDEFVTNYPGIYYAKLMSFEGIDESAHFWTSSTDAQNNDCPVKILTSKGSEQPKPTCAESENDFLSIRCVKINSN